MDKSMQDPVFKKGIWIKEQQGILTIGSLDENEPETMVIPQELSSKILAFEDEMINALYGEKALPFNPQVLDMEKLLSKIKTKFIDIEIRTSFSNPQNKKFKGSYDEIFNLLEKLILTSCTDIRQENGLIYINTSIVEDHLCIIYRDTGSILDPTIMKKDFSYITDILKGEVSYKKTSENRSYYDIMIPSKA